MHKKRKKKNNILLDILLVFLVLMFVGGCCVMGWMTYRMQERNVVLKQQMENLSSENSEMQKELQKLQEKISEYEIVIEDYQQKQEAEEQRLLEEQEMAMFADLEPGTILDPSQVTGNEEVLFEAYDIVEGDAVYNRIIGKSYRENPNIGLADLKYLKVLHYNFDHQIQVGELIVNAAISQDVLSIFKELYAIEYEVYSMYLVDNYWTGDGGTSDSASIDVNNTSAFNYREVTGGSSLSNHAYGCAIDINPQQNPYVWISNGVKQWSHSNANDYIENRNRGDLHIIVQGDVCYSIFEKYGFSWGGNWSNPLDYQHFEKELY